MSGGIHRFDHFRSPPRHPWGNTLCPASKLQDLRLSYSRNERAILPSPSANGTE